jgi:hypothetical protein
MRPGGTGVRDPLETDIFERRFAAPPIGVDMPVIL